jgi:phosphate transport system substrate-binding protein
VRGRSRLIGVAALVGAGMVALVAAGCGGGGGASITADGSSTVGPFTTLAAERFKEVQPDVNVTVGISGTGGGFERFCVGETDVSNASRPIEGDEAQTCADNSIDYIELQVANDALTVIVNGANEWASCLTVEQLKQMWEPGSSIDSWQDVDASFPDRRLTLFGPGTDSGTFDYFTGAIVGEEGSSRSDYQASEDDNVIVQGVAGDEGSLGYLGFSYFEENQATLKALAVDAGDGCVEPSAKTAQSGTYTPLARPLFVYVKTASLQRPEVEAFVRYMLDNAISLAREARFVAVTPAQKVEAMNRFESAAGTT